MSDKMQIGISCGGGRWSCFDKRKDWNYLGDPAEWPQAYAQWLPCAG
jgi:hypothetical protein